MRSMQASARAATLHARLVRLRDRFDVGAGVSGRESSDTGLVASGCGGSRNCRAAHTGRVLAPAPRTSTPTMSQSTSPLMSPTVAGRDLPSRPGPPGLTIRFRGCGRTRRAADRSRCRCSGCRGRRGSVAPARWRIRVGRSPLQPPASWRRRLVRSRPTSLSRRDFVLVSTSGRAGRHRHHSGRDHRGGCDACRLQR